jgi:hypothetical protein
MGLYTGPWRTAIFLGATTAMGGALVGLALWPGGTGRLRLGLVGAGALWCGFFTAVLGGEIKRHWHDRADDE